MAAGDFPTTWQIRDILEPLREVKQCKSFEVTLMWRAPESLWGLLGETPFVLKDGGVLWEGVSPKVGVVSGGLIEGGWAGWSRRVGNARGGG
jgi:hypothetical protein